MSDGDRDVHNRTRSVSMWDMEPWCAIIDARNTGISMTPHTNVSARSAAQVLVDQLRIQGVSRVFCVPGESYLPVLDALYDSGIAVTTCRNEGGASMMAEAWGKQTGRPGICFVTRGPGATNGSGGVHIA